jgi:hypothetical protein
MIVSWNMSLPTDSEMLEIANLCDVLAANWGKVVDWISVVIGDIILFFAPEV